MLERESIIKPILAKLQNVLTEAREDFTSDPNLFYRLKLFKMAKFIPLTCEIMKAVNSRDDESMLEELELIDDEVSGDSNLLETIKQFRSDWNLFLQEIDGKVIL